MGPAKQQLSATQCNAGRPVRTPADSQSSCDEEVEQRFE
jgi:hypothetical protein